MINPILYQNQVDKYPEIYNDYQNMRAAVQGKSSDAALEAVPFYGKINSLPDKLEQKDYLPATGILGAIGAKHLGPTGSLVGISAGTLIGALTNNAIN